MKFFSNLETGSLLFPSVGKMVQKKLFCLAKKPDCEALPRPYTALADPGGAPGACPPLKGPNSFALTYKFYKT